MGGTACILSKCSRVADKVWSSIMAVECWANKTFMVRNRHVEKCYGSSDWFLGKTKATTGYVPVAISCEHENEAFGSLTCRELLASCCFSRRPQLHEDSSYRNNLDIMSCGLIGDLTTVSKSTLYSVGYYDWWLENCEWLGGKQW
jgi:hypothetical protein